MRKLPLLLLFFLLPLACQHQPTTLYVIETTDLHGEFGYKMAGIAGYINQAKQQYGDSLIVLDCGDFLQGSPEIFFANYVDTVDSHIYAKIINSLPYDAIAVGNHDFEAGENIYSRFYDYLNIPVLCANIVYTDSQKPKFTPYTVLRRNGYKIAVLGMVTTSALEWLPEDLRKGTSFIPIGEAADYWVHYINKKVKPDVLIGLFHTGNNNEDDSAKWIAQRTPGIDLICCGHIHRADISHEISPEGDSIVIIEAGAHASHIGKSVLSLTPKQTGKPDIKVSAELIPTDNLAPDSSYEKLMETFFRLSSIYNDVPISTIDTTIYSRDALYGPSAWTDLLHISYRKIAENMGYKGTSSVDVTIVSPSFRDAVLYEGQLTVRDFTLLYPHENTLSIMEMTGEEIKNYLEYVHSLPLENPDSPIYDFDSAGGIIYKVDKSQPYGSRITITNTDKGNTIYATRRYRVAMNSFRAMGGGGHLSKGLHWTQEKMKARTLDVSEKSIRASFFDIYSEEPIRLYALNYWNYLQ